MKTSKNLYANRRLLVMAAGCVLLGALLITLLVGDRRWLVRPLPHAWVEVPAGEFQMGSTDEQLAYAVDLCVEAGNDQGNCEGWYNDEQPAHTVTLDAFRISQREVTNAEYARCVQSTRCDKPGDLTAYQDPDYANHPVVYVDWNDAQTFCEWVGDGLPTEAQWEYAARGPEGNIFPWGDEFACAYGNFDDETTLDNYVVPGGAGCDGYDLTAPVGSFPQGASWVGALDMAGNVWEWTADWYGEYPDTAQTNPVGLDTGDFRVVRGGSFYLNPNYLRSAYRRYDIPAYRYYYLGFRCVAARPGN